MIKCENCKYAKAAEDTWDGKVVSYFCDKNKKEYTVCDVGFVSPNYSCEEGKDESKTNRSKW